MPHSRHSCRPRYSCRPVLVAVQGFLSAFLLAGCIGGDGIAEPEDTPGDPVATTVSVTPVSSTLEAGGESVQLTAEVLDQSGDPIPDAAVSWSAAPQAVATVGTSGVVTSHTAGTATVTAASGDASGSAQVTVTPPPVASVEVTPPSVTIEPGSAIQLSAVLRDDGEEPLAGREVSWSSSNSDVADVDDSGLVTGISHGGPVTITAASEGVSGTASITVFAPVESVTLTGRTRVKVGDTYTYTAEARLGDGTVVDRPMSWGIAETHLATMTPDGTLTPTGTGEITIQVTIDGEVGETEMAVEAYDWVTISESGHLFLALFADTPITSSSGTPAWPEMVFVCDASGLFIMGITTDPLEAESGAVSYSFDGGPEFTGTWVELQGALSHPGPTNLATKSFALDMAQARTFEFGFIEVQSGPQTTTFRVTGMAPRLDPLLDACPSNAVGAGASAAHGVEGRAERPVSARRALLRGLPSAP